MSTTRRCGLTDPVRFLRLILPAALILASACVSTPKEAPREDPAAAEPASAEDLKPEVVEIRGPIPLPTRVALVLPDPEPKPAPGAVSRLPPPQAAPAASAAIPAPASSAAAMPSGSGASPPSPGSLPAPEPVPSASTTGKTLPPVPAAPQAPAASAAVPAPVSKPPEPGKPPAGDSPPKAAESKAAPAKPPASPAKPPADAAARAPAAPETPPKPALVPSPGSSTRTSPESVQAPGRTEEAVRGSPLELPFRGSGWIYLGETGGRDGLRYESRKFDGTQAIFLFTAERPGEYQLRFQRQDALTGEPENLIVKVLVREPEPGSAAGVPSRPASGSSAPAASALGAAVAGQPAAAAAGAAPTGAAPPGATAPSQPSSAAEGNPPSAAAASAAPPGAAGEPSRPPAAASAPRDLPASPEELLRLAREDLAASRIAGVLEVLDRYMQLFPFGSDEAHYLYAKAYEQNTPYRDIKKAYANYRKVRDEWPRSPFWRESAERVTYIERHYFDIR